jgi:hypothetical protein
VPSRADQSAMAHWKRLRCAVPKAARREKAPE